MSKVTVTDLVDLGFSEKEAAVYLSLLSLGIATATDVAKSSGVSRGSVYAVIDSLLEKGFASSVQSAKVQQFIAASPEMLKKLPEHHLRRELEKKEYIQHILPDLKGLFRDTKYKPGARVLEGEFGLKSALNEALDSSEKMIRVFTSGEAILKLIPEHLIYWAEERIRKDIKLKSIYVDNQSIQTIIQMAPSLGEVAFVSGDNYPFPVDVTIVDNKIGYFVVENDSITTTILESKEISFIMKNLFDMTFDQILAEGGRYLEI